MRAKEKGPTMWGLFLCLGEGKTDVSARTSATPQ
jgi:hypothetical protein